MVVRIDLLSEFDALKRNRLTRRIADERQALRTEVTGDRIRDRRSDDVKSGCIEDQKVNALYGTVQIPETYIIDKQGVLRRKFIGAQVWTSPEITSYLSRM